MIRKSLRSLTPYNFCFPVFVSFDPTSYTVTEGEDGFAELTLVRSGDTSGETSVTVISVPGTASGKPGSHKETTDHFLFFFDSWR